MIVSVMRSIFVQRLLKTNLFEFCCCSCSIHSENSALGAEYVADEMVLNQYSCDELVTTDK